VHNELTQDCCFADVYLLFFTDASLTYAVVLNDMMVVNNKWKGVKVVVG
jgi:hypothetical protein